MLLMHFDRPGRPEYHYVKDVAKPSPGDGEVLLKVTASTLNRDDILQYLGIPMVNPGQTPEINLCFQWAEQAQRRYWCAVYSETQM